VLTKPTITRTQGSRCNGQAASSSPFPFPFPYPTARDWQFHQPKRLRLRSFQFIDCTIRERGRVRARERRKMAGGGCRPDSVPRRAASIHLGRALPRGSSSQPGDLTHTRWDAGTGTLGPPIRPCSAWGLPCPLRFRRGGALLPHPFTLTPGLSGAVYSLRHFPSRCHGRALPGMPPAMESGPSSETEVPADARLLQPALG